MAKRRDRLTVRGRKSRGKAKRELEKTGRMVGTGPGHGHIQRTKIEKFMAQFRPKKKGK